MKKYFGTDGIRGEYGKILTNDLAYMVGASLFLLNNRDVIIGCDTRVSSPQIVESVAQGSRSKGLNVTIVNVIPTPGLIYYSQMKRVIGVIITASHNPFQDNGIKIVLNGKKISLKQEELIEKYLHELHDIKSIKRDYIFSNEAIEEYQRFLFLHKVKHNFLIGIDCANGSTYEVAKKIYQDALFVGDKPDGYNINDKCGSTHLNSLISLVKNNKCHFGFAYDGDGDRVLAVDESGIKYDGDMLVYIIAKYLLEKNLLNKKTVVLSIMSNLGLINELKKSGINVVLTDVGDKYIQSEIDNHDYALGGENSGHIITPYLKSGDGILVSLLIVKIMTESGQSLFELTKDIIMYHDKMVNIRVKNKDIIKNSFLESRVLEISNILGNEGKVILRASGTEDLIRISVMAKNEGILNMYLDELVSIVNQLNGGVI